MAGRDLPRKRRYNRGSMPTIQRFKPSGKLGQRRGILLPALVLAGAGLALASGATPRRGAWQSSTAPVSSHERMKARLAEIARTSPHERVFRLRLEETRTDYAALADDGPLEQRLQIAGALAEAELRMGNSAAAIQLFRSILDSLSQLSPSVRGRYAITTVFLLGVAHVREAETINCVQRHSPEACILPLRGAGVHSDPTHAAAAIPLFADIVRNTPGQHPINIAAKWLLNLAAMMIGRYPDGLDADLRIAPEVFQSEIDFPRFRNVAPAVGLAQNGYAGGVVVEDFDADGLLDVMTSTVDPAGQLRLFHNQGDGQFVEITESAGLIGIIGGVNMVQADYDNDGDIDVLVVRGAWLAAEGRWVNSLLRNNGDRTFTDVTYDVGLGDVEYPTHTAAWGDYDNDGDLDLYIGNESTQELGYPSQLYRNGGDGTFVEVSETAGVQNYRWSKGVVWGDFNDDDYPDLYVSNYAGANRLYRNNRDGTFTDVAADLGVSQPVSSFAVWFWDANNDGRLDLLVNTYQKVIEEGDSPPVWYVAASRMGLPFPADVPRLYLGQRGGGFVEGGGQYGLNASTLPMGANFGDLDNDGWLDFFLGTGYPGYEGLMPNVMYRSEGGRRFVDVTFAGGFGHLQKGHGIAFADLDNDGDQDVFAQMGGMWPSDPYPNALFENPGFGNHWVKIQLVGTRSNRQGVGARIRVDVVDGDQIRSIYHHVGSGGSFGANPLRAEIGLGAAGRIERLQVHWPASGLTQSFEDLAVDRLYRITEGSNELRQLELPTFAFPPPSPEAAGVGSPGSVISR